MVTRFEMETPRMMKARKMLEQGVSFKSMGKSVYYVESQSKPGKYYTVADYNGRWSCDCPDHEHNHVRCKHIWLVILTLEKETREPKVLEPIENVECPVCHSKNIMKWGIRHNKSGDLQRYQCNDCGKTFTINIGFERMKHNPKAITTAMQLYFSGESLRNTQRSLRLLGVDVCHKTVSNWINKYISIMKQYTDNLKPQVGSDWRADEVWIKVKGDMKYLFALMDDETRYWISQEVADTKEKHDARNLFATGREIAGKRPELLITDGLQSYKDAFKQEFYSTKVKKSISTLSSLRAT